MHRVWVSCVSTLMLLAMLTSGSFADRWGEYGEFAKPQEAMDPTPAGTGHIGEVASGTFVQFRFSVPEDEAVGYWVRLANVVAYTGKGTSYQLVLRRDAENGAIVHTGVLLTNGDRWNDANRGVVDLTEAITQADRERGYIDVFVTGMVEGDDWTVYRQGSRQALAYAAVMSPEMRRQMIAAQALKDSGIALIPMPSSIEVTPGEQLKISASTRIVYPEGASDSIVFTANELRTIITERCELDLPVVAVQARADVSGMGEAGCLYGAMTLGQMVRPNGEGGVSLPVCTVEDEPAFEYRIIQYDIARGQTVNVDYVKRVIRELARCKINGLLFYMEEL